MHINTIRHDSIFPLEHRNHPVTIIGAGATGSRVFTSLVELGMTNITVVDFDIVESHNLANQAYVESHIGLKKVAACHALYRLMTGYDAPESMFFIDDKVPGSAKVEGIVFLLTDTMSSRKEIFDECLKDNLDVDFVIETRMASSYGNILCFDPNHPQNAADWQATLISDDDAEVSACGASISVGPTASIIANMAVWSMIHHLTNPEALEPRTDIFLKPTTITTGTL